MTSKIMRSELKTYKNFNAAKIKFAVEQRDLYSIDNFIPDYKIVAQHL